MNHEDEEFARRVNCQINDLEYIPAEEFNAEDEQDWHAHYVRNTAGKTWPQYLVALVRERADHDGMFEDLVWLKCDKCPSEDHYRKFGPAAIKELAEAYDLDPSELQIDPDSFQFQDHEPDRGVELNFL